MSILVASNVQFTAQHTDPKLINPVDIAVSCDSIWVSITRGGIVQKYSHKGKLLSSITVTTPTGLDFHCGTLYVGSQNGSIYTIKKGMTTPTTYLLVPGGGSIEGIAWHRGALFAAISDRGYVGEYKNKNAVLSIANEPLFSFGYRPYGLRALDDRIYIAYSDGMSTMVGSGYVGVYDPKCRTLTNLISRDGLSFPYGLAMIDDKLLVGNRGTGRIWTYDKETGERIESRSEDITRSSNDGIMGMRVDADGRLLWFVAANDNGLMGSVGVISI